METSQKEKHAVESTKDAEGNLSNDRRIVYVLGAPGSGKTTHCSKLAAEFGYHHLVTSNLLQEEIESGSENGKLIQELKKEGKLVPTEITVKLVQQAMLKSETNKFIMDGFPRNEENLTAAENILKIEPDLVLFLDCSESESTRRLLNRNQGRIDDNEETIKKRFKVYLESTLPVINYYTSKARIQKIDAERPIDEVYESVKTIFSEFVTIRGIGDEIQVGFRTKHEEG